MKTLVTGNGNKLSYFRQKTHKYTYVCTHTYMPICTYVCVCVYGERERESITGSAGARESDSEVTAELRPSLKLMLQRESAGPTPCCLHRRHQSWTITLSVHTCYLREVASGASTVALLARVQSVWSLLFFGSLASNSNSWTGTSSGKDRGPMPPYYAKSAGKANIQHFQLL